MSLQYGNFIATVRVPDTDSVIPRPACKMAAVWSQRHALDKLIMPTEPGQFLATVRVPYPQHLVAAGADKAATIQSKHHAIH